MSQPTDVDPSPSEPTPSVRHDAEASRFELLIDGRVVSLADYEDDAAGVRAFTHTYTDPSERGLGYAAVLVAAALDDARATGHRVVPACWFVREYIEENPAYRDLLA